MEKADQLLQLRVARTTDLRLILQSDTEDSRGNTVRMQPSIGFLLRYKRRRESTLVYLRVSEGEWVADKKEKERECFAQVALRAAAGGESRSREEKRWSSVT